MEASSPPLESGRVWKLETGKWRREDGGEKRWKLGLGNGIGELERGEKAREWRREGNEREEKAREWRLEGGNWDWERMNGRVDGK